MFILIQVFRNGRTGSIDSKAIVEDGLSTIDEARQTAYEYGAGEYRVLSRSRPPGNRVVERIRVGTNSESRKSMRV